SLGRKGLRVRRGPRDRRRQYRRRRKRRRQRWTTRPEISISSARSRTPRSTPTSTAAPHPRRPSALYTTRMHSIPRASRERRPSLSSVVVQSPALTCRYAPPMFTEIRPIWLRNVEVVGSSPITSTRCHYHNDLPDQRLLARPITRNRT